MTSEWQPTRQLNKYLKIKNNWETRILMWKWSYLFLLQFSHILLLFYKLSHYPDSTCYNKFDIVLNLELPKIDVPTWVFLRTLHLYQTVVSSRARYFAPACSGATIRCWQRGRNWPNWFEKGWKVGQYIYFFIRLCQTNEFITPFFSEEKKKVE